MIRSVVAAAALLLVTLPHESVAQTPPVDVLSMCSGGKTGNYFFAVSEILKRVSRDQFREGRNIETAGSLDNLRKMSSGQCAIAPAQADIVNIRYPQEDARSRDAFAVLKVLYREYTHILCPTAMKARNLYEFANLPGTKKLIVGPDGAGSAETWRIMVNANEKLYKPIVRDDQPTDINSVTTVMDSSDTCMLWVSGLNSNDMSAANIKSVATRDGKPSLKLISVEDKAFDNIKGLDGKPIYKKVTVTPAPGGEGRPALYNNLINNGGWFTSASVDMLSIPALLMIRTDWREAIGRPKLTRINTAIGDAQSAIWARVNPAGSDNSND